MNSVSIPHICILLLSFQHIQCYIILHVQKKQNHTSDQHNIVLNYCPIAKQTEVLTSPDEKSKQNQLQTSAGHTLSCWIYLTKQLAQAGLTSDQMTTCAQLAEQGATRLVVTCNRPADANELTVF